MTKMTLGLQNHWRMANSGVGIMPRDLTLAEIRSNTLIGRSRGWHYNRGAIQRGRTVYPKNGDCLGMANSLEGVDQTNIRAFSRNDLSSIW